MAKAFNLTAQINLQGPANIKPVVAKIKRELGSISTNVDIKFDSKVAKNVQALTGRLGSLNTVLIETNRNSRDLATTLTSLSTAFSSLGSASKSVSGIESATKSVTSTTKAVQQATSEMTEFGKQSALAVRRFAAFSVATTGIFALINAINSGTRAFISFDQELIKLRQITGAGAVGIKELENEITRLAVNLGVSSEKLTEIAIVLAQAGLTASETKTALAALAKTELAPSFENLNKTTEGAIAALRQFDIEVVDLEKALGSINAVAAAFAVESGDIISAIQRAGGAFAASSKGVSEGTSALNEFIAVFTSVRATTRESAETIATGLRTIFTRIQRGSTIKFLREFGVELTDTEGKFIGTYKGVQKLSEVLNTLDPRDLRFAQIVEELGGFRQIGKVIPLIQQFSDAQKALAVAQRGQGSLAETQTVAQLALANQIARVREEFLALFRSIGQSQTFQFLFKGVVSLTSGLIKLVSVFKPILPLLSILAGIKGLGAVTQFAGGFIGGLRRGGGPADIGDNIGANISGATDKTRSDATEKATTALSNNTDSLKTLTVAVQALTQAINTKLGGGGTTLNSGGKVLAFSKGGSVPGRGNKDSVPAYLQPGEFVLRKQAVNSIGKHKLNNINKYAKGRRVKSKTYNISDLKNSKISEFMGNNSTLEDNDTIWGIINNVDMVSPLSKPEIDSIYNTKPFSNPLFKKLYKDSNNRSILGAIRNPGSSDAAKQKALSQLADKYPSLDTDLFAAEAASSERSWGVGYEKIIRDRFKTGSASDDPLYPIDTIERLSGDKRRFGEIKFKTQPEKEIDLVRKLLTARLFQNQKNRYFKENIVQDRDLDKNIGIIDYFFGGNQNHKQQFYNQMLFGGKIKKFMAGGEAEEYYGKAEVEAAKAALAEYRQAVEQAFSFENIYFEALEGKSIADGVTPEVFGTGIGSLPKGTPGVVGTKKIRLSQAINDSDTVSVAALDTMMENLRRSAFSAREAQMKAYTEAEQSISAFKASGLLENLDPGIFSYIQETISNLQQGTVDPEVWNEDGAAGITRESALKKLTPANLKAFAALQQGQRVEVQGQRTKLSEIFGSILETYSSDVSAREQSNITSKLADITLKQSRKANSGGIIRAFRVGGIQEPLSLEEAKSKSSGEIISELGIDQANAILKKYWTGPIPQDPRKKTSKSKLPIVKTTNAREVLDSRKLTEWTGKYSGSDFLKKINEARAALYSEYQKKVNERRGASAPLSGTDVQTAINSGLLFGVAGMYGNGFPPRKLELIPGQTQDEAINNLKGPVSVSLVGGVLAKNEAEKQKRFQAQVLAAKGLENLGDTALDLETAPTQKELSKKFGVKASLYAIQKANKDRAINYVNAIAKSLDPTSGGSQIFLDFDKTLAFGADKITKLDASGRPDYSAFSDPVEVQKGLSTAKLSKLGNRLKELVKQSDAQQAGLGSELLNRMFVVSARPPQTMGLIAQWLQSKGLNIPSGNVIGVGGAGKSPNDIAISKAEEILSKLSGNRSIFIDDDLRNIDTARTRGLRASQYGADIDKKAIKDAQDREGTSFEKFVRENLPPNLVRAMTSQVGESIDYPKGLGDTVAAWFNEPLLASIPTDVKRTVSGIGKVKSNIANFLRKNLGYKFGGAVNGESFEDVKKKILEKYPEIAFRVSKRKKGRGFGYNLLGALRKDGIGDPLLTAGQKLEFEQPSNLQKLMEAADEMAAKLIGSQKANFGGFINKFGYGGSVPALLTPGEAVIDPSTAKKIGYSKLDKMNYADKNSSSSKGLSSNKVSIVPGSGNTDTFGPVPLPIGSYVIRKKATKALGFNKGGTVGGVQKFAGGRRVGVIAEDRRLAELFKQLSSNIRGGMTSTDAFDRVVESARTDFPEAANLLKEAAESFRSGANPREVFARFGGELARKAPDSFASFALEADAFADLAKIVNSAADTMDLFALEATDAGSSLETFEANLKKRLQEQIFSREAQRRSSRVDLTREFIRGRSTDPFDTTAFTDTVNKLREPFQSLVGSLAGVDPAAIESTLQSIVAGSAAGESLEDLRARLPLLDQALNNTIDRTTALATVESEAVAAMGGLTASVRSTVEELDAIDYARSGQARAEFGVIGEANPAGALRFKNSAIGGRALKLAQGFQENLLLGSIPVVGSSLNNLGKVVSQLPGPIGNAVRAIGGLPGALAAVASIIGSEFLPQLGQFLGMAEDANFAGISGGVSQSGSMAVSLGTIGQQIGGTLGGVIGTIGGAISGFIKGYTESFRRQELTNALKSLTTSSERAKVALDNLSKYDSAENALAVQKAVLETEVAARDLEKLSQRTTGERATDAATYGLIGTTIAGVIAAALVPFTGGLSALALGGLLAGGAAAGGVYGATRGPTEMDDEALKAYLDSLTSINDTLSTLAQRDIKFTSLENLNKIINDFRDSAGNIDNAALGKQSEYIRQAQEAALRAAGFSISSTESLESQLRSLGAGAQSLADVTAAQFAYEAGLEELSRQLNGNLVAIRAATDTEEERQKITQRGFERIGEERRQLALQQRLTLISRQVALETEKLSDVYTKLLAAIQRYNDALNQSDIAIANSTDILLNQNRLNKVDRTDQQVLRNSRAYSPAELDRVLQKVEDLAGGGQRGRELTDVVRGRRIVEDQLPQILRNVTQRNVGDVSSSIADLFAKANIGRDVTNALIEEIEKVLESETSGRQAQGKSFDELVQQFPSLQKAMESMEKANESAIALLEAQSNLYDKVVDRLNSFGEALQKSSEWAIKSADIRIQAENELAKALGKSVSLDSLNRALNSQIEALTADTNRGFGGTTNPAQIANRIRENQRLFEANQNDIQNQPSTAQGRQTVSALLKEQEKLKRSSSNLYQALEKLATSGDNASNALNKLQERRQIGENAADLLEKVFTQGAEEADRMFRSFGAVQDALNGNLLFRNQNERVLAFEGLRTLLPLLSNEIGSQLRAAFLENMLRGNNVNLNDTLIPGIGGQGKFTFQDIINNLRNPEADPATKALIDSYLQANQLMRDAATEISRLNAEAATKFAQAADRLVAIPIPGLPGANPDQNQMSSDIRDLRNAALSRGSLYTHDIKTEELLKAILQNNAQPSNGPVLGPDNLTNINLPIFEKISTVLPDLNNEMLNVVKTLEILNIKVTDLTEAINGFNSRTDNGRSSGSRTAKTSETLNINIDKFATSTTEFGNYVTRLEKIKFPEKITMGGSYTLDVRVSGAAAFQALEEKTKDIIDAEIRNKLGELEQRIAKATGYAVDPRRREP